MEKRTTLSVWYYLIVVAAILFTEFTLFAGSGVKELSYSEFRDLLSAGKIQSVTIRSHEIDGLLKPAPQDKNAPIRKSMPGAISSSSQTPVFTYLRPIAMIRPITRIQKRKSNVRMAISFSSFTFLSPLPAYLERGMRTVKRRAKRIPTST
jgi:ATP-dependent Zn protease